MKERDKSREMGKWSHNYQGKEDRKDCMGKGYGIQLTIYNEGDNN